MMLRFTIYPARKGGVFMGKRQTDGTLEEKKQRKKRLQLSIAALCVAGAAVAGAGLGTMYTTCYTVEYQGSTIAYVTNKDAIASAVLQAESRASDLLDTDYSFGQDLQVKTVIVPRDSVPPSSDTADSLMEQVPGIVRLYTLTVDGEYIGATEKAETITRALERVKNIYRTPETVSVAVESQLDVEHTFLPKGAPAMDEDQLTEALMAWEIRTFPYTTQEGDTMESVARLFGMDLQRLNELNSGTELEIAATDADIASLDEILGDTEVTAQAAGDPAEEADPIDPAQTEGEADATDDILPEDMVDVDPEQLAAQAVREAYAAVDAASVVTENEEDLVLTEAPLNPGQQLTVEQSCTRLVVSTVEEQTVDREVQPEKLTLLDSTIPLGTQEVLVEGTSGVETVMTRVTKRCGVAVSSADLSSVSRRQAEPLLVAVGYGSHPELYDFFSVGDIMFQWPVQGSISSDYGYRHIFGGLNFHRGVDIPAPMGTAVHAAANGTVVFAGVKGSYGNLVIIDHGNGFQTLYGHNSGFLVKAGDVVSKGQTIAAVGSTGRSTGPHCHFEVHLNGELVDPLMYLPGENNAPARLQIPLSELNQGEAASAQETASENTQKPAENPAPAAPAGPAQPAQEAPAETPAVEPGSEIPPAQEIPADQSGEAAGETPAEAPVEAPPQEASLDPVPAATTPVSDALAESLAPAE